MIIGTKTNQSTYFSDFSELASYSPYKISSLKLYFSLLAIEGIKVTYYSFCTKNNIKCQKHQSSKLIGVYKANISLDENEFLISISGLLLGKDIVNLHLKTSLNRQLTIGGN